jgi:hypothetical protein
MDSGDGLAAFLARRIGFFETFEVKGGAGHRGVK